MVVCVLFDLFLNVRFTKLVRRRYAHRRQAINFIEVSCFDGALVSGHQELQLSIIFK